MTLSVKNLRSLVKSPITCGLGSIWMAGWLHGKSRIPEERMRVLGRYALVLVLGGEIFYADATGLRRNLSKGDVILVRPDLGHAYGSADGQPWSQIYVIFSGPQFDLLQQSPDYHQHHPVWHLEPVELWERRLEEILSTGTSRRPDQGLQTVGRFNQLLIEMSVSDASARERPDEEWLEESFQLLGESHKEGWMNPQEVARTLGQSYEAFRKRFAVKTGQAPGQFQRQRRIDLACSAIYQGRDNFKELAEELGFCDVYHFSKVFRQIVGSPPATYRRTVRGG